MAENLAGQDDLSLLRNQVRSFISNLNTKSSYLNADNNTEFAGQLLERAKRHYGKKEIKENVPEFYNDELPGPTSLTGKDRCIARTRELLDSMTILLSYLDYHLGDPVAMELLSDTLDQARAVLRQDLRICSVLLCRVTLEQALRRLCERGGIAFEPNERASSLNDKLRNGRMLQVHQHKEVDAKLTFENKVIHRDIEASKEEAENLIAWTERFLTGFLEGHDS